MNELSKEQVDELRAALESAREELERLLEATRESARPISLDGLDAIEQQGVAAQNRRGYDLRLRQVKQALALMLRDDYGLCRKCEDPIGYARLQARPESPYCLGCQDDIDRKHG